MKNKKDFVIVMNNTSDGNVIKATAGAMPKSWHFEIYIGGIVISKPRSGKQGVIHITTGRADSLEGGDFKVSELEKAIQDFFDKNF